MTSNLRRTERGFWNAVDSLNSGDYRYTFFITGFVYLSASLVTSLLLPFVPRREGALADISEYPTAAEVSLGNMEMNTD